MLVTQTSSSYVTRRATVEDLPQLIPLWRLERLPADVLEKRFTEFQIVSDDEGRVLATVAIQIAGSHGRLHSEAIAQPEHTDQFRELLWKRLQIVIQNHALERLWTQMAGTFWRDRGFSRATEEQIKTLPAGFASEESGWQTLTLRAGDANAALEREFARFKALQQEETIRLRQRVQLAKRVALGTAIVVFSILIALAVTLLAKRGLKLLH